MTVLAYEHAEKLEARGGRLRSLADRFLRSELSRGEGASVGPMFALMLVPIAGSIAYAVELGGSMYFQRSMQNAADAAALAAASNNTGAASTGTTPQIEARAAALPYGYVDGTAGVTVTAGLTTCPPGTPGTSPVCYEAIVTDSFPLTFSRLIGFMGTGGSGNQLVRARSVATAAGGGGGAETSACYWALSSDPQALRGNGLPFANLDGCSVFSNGGIACMGGTLKADYALAAGPNTPNCACPAEATCDDGTRTEPYNRSGVSIPPDPYGGTPYSTNANTALASSCTSNPPKQGTTSATLLVYCGGLTIAKDKTLTLTSPNTVVVIKGGPLDLTAGDSRILTGPGASATIIFDTMTYPFTDKKVNGTIDIAAPNTDASPWKGVAMYRKPGGSQTPADWAGAKATINITGLVYLPNVDVTFNGIVNKATGGSPCFVLMANTILLNGNGTVANTLTGCDSAGLDPPSVVVGVGTREKLVL